MIDIKPKDDQPSAEWTAKELGDDIRCRTETGEVFVIEYDQNKISPNEVYELFNDIEKKVGAASVIAIPNKQYLISGMSKSECIEMLENLMDYVRTEEPI